MKAVQEANKKLKEFNKTASITSKIEGMNYEDSSKQSSRVYEIEEFYLAYRLHQLIYANKKSEKSYCIKKRSI